MFSSSRIGIVILVAAGILPISCRTYGGHGSEAATLDQIEAAYEAFARQLGQARNDLRSMQGEPGMDERSTAVLERLDAAVEWHVRVLADHEQRVEQARRNAGSYRFLSRTLGGMISEQDLVQSRYQAILDQARSAPDTAVSVGSPMAGARYHVVPPFYERLENASQRRAVGTLSWTLDGAALGPAPATSDSLADPSAEAASETNGGAALD